jgi:signal peptidase I
MGRAVLAAFVSLVFPGFGHGVMGRRVQSIAWAASGFLAVIAIIFSVWMIYVLLLARVICAIDTVRILRHKTGKIEWITEWSGIALVLGAIELGSSRFAIELFKVPSSSMYPTVVIGDRIIVDKLSIHWRALERGEVVAFKYPCTKDRTYIKRIVAVDGDTVEVRCNIVYVNGEPVPSELVDAAASYRDFDESTRGWYARESSLYRETLDGHDYETFHDRGRPQRDKQRETLTADAHDFPQRDRSFAPSCHGGADAYYQPGEIPEQPQGKLVSSKPIEVATACEPQMHFVVPAKSLFVLGDNRNNANDSRYWGAVSTDSVIGRVIGVYYSQGEDGYDWGRIGAIR